MNSPPAYDRFREDLVAGRRLVGTFLKMPTTQTVEILASVGFDFVVIDQEHAPLDRGTTDLMILAARAGGISPVVRVPDESRANILSVLDCGASGIMVPHIDSADKAKEVVRACRYRDGARGFAGVTRSSGWGSASMYDHIAAQDSRATFIAMIEDLHALDRVDEICAVDGVDALFIGRGDLTAALGKGNSGRVGQIVESIAASARRNRKPLITLAATRAEAQQMAQLGSTVFLASSDHQMIRASAISILGEFTEKSGGA
jgi:2-keto-3-deoxy-L-rhamnonate aldolase RhmA